MLACSRAEQFLPWSYPESAWRVVAQMGKATGSRQDGDAVNYCKTLAQADEGDVIAAIVNACGTEESERG